MYSSRPFKKYNGKYKRKDFFMEKKKDLKIIQTVITDMKQKIWNVTNL